MQVFLASLLILLPTRHWLKQLSCSFIHIILHPPASFPIFLLLPSLLLPVSDTVCKHVPCANLGQSAAQRGLLFRQLVHLFVEVSSENFFASAATLSNASTLGETFLCHRLHSHHLPRADEPNEVTIRAPKAQDKCKILPYPYPFSTNDEVRKLLGSTNTSGFYA